MAASPSVAAPLSSADSVGALGPLVSDHPSLTNQQRMYRNAWISLASGVGLLVVGALPIVFQFRGLWGLLLLVGMVGLILVIVAPFSLLDARTKPDVSAAVYRDGIAVRGPQGVQVCRWDEAGQIWSSVTRVFRNRVHINTIHVHSVEKRTGERLNVTERVANVEQFMAAVRANVYPRIFSAYIQAYNAGQSVVFGPVMLSQAGGLQMAGKQYPWSEVKQVSIQQGVLSVAKKDGGWFSGATVQAGSVPNLDILLQMVDQIVGLTVPTRR